MKIRVRPYYLYQCDQIRGGEHFRTPISKGLEIMEGLRGHTSGLAIPTYVIDAPGGGGKIPVAPQYLLQYEPKKKRAILRNFQGKIFEYHEPAGRAALLSGRKTPRDGELRTSASSNGHPAANGSAGTNGNGLKNGAGNDKEPASGNGHANGSGNGHAKGNGNGHADGNAHGAANGHSGANGNANGNGHAETIVDPAVNADTAVRLGPDGLPIVGKSGWVHRGHSREERIKKASD
jgi:hypothetical protein